MSTPSTQHAERTVLSESRTSTPKPADGQIEAIRPAKTAQDTEVKGHWTAIITLKVVLVSAGDDTDRTRFEAAFTKLRGACPIPTGPGETLGRRRLNRCGNQQANTALYRSSSSECAGPHRESNTSNDAPNKDSPNRT
jgi:transposase